MKEILQQFCGDFGDREYLTMPFSHGDSTYASDARICIKVPRYPHHDAPWANARQLEAIKKIEDYLRTEYTNYFPLPAPPQDGYGTRCPLCEGKGYGNHVECTCCGSDEVETTHNDEPCPRCENGKITWECRVNIGTQSVNSYYLVKLGLLKNVQIANHPDGGINQLKFTFDGGVGLLMPMRPKEDAE